MSSACLVLRSSRMVARSIRPFSTSTTRFADINDRGHDNADEYRQYMNRKPLNPHLTNTNSTIANEMPSLGKDSAPPELLTSVDPDFVAKDSVPENTERMTGGTQKPGPDGGKNSELDVGELEGATFRVEPLRRQGEDPNTMRARLLYQCRKRGTLESDLLLSTFADVNLGTMSPAQLQQFDLFLDENDWDIYYWATQQPTPTSMAYAEGAGPQHASPEAQGQAHAQSPEKPEKGMKPVEKGTGEWAQTVGTFKPAYRPVPARWKNSEILSLLRKHVEHRSAGGVIEAGELGTSEGSDDPGKGTGLGFMPELKTFDRA